MHAAEGEAWSLSCLFLFWFCCHGGFSPEELALILGSCGGDLGTFSPLPTLGLFWVLAWGSAGGPVSEELSEREEGQVLPLGFPKRSPFRKDPDSGGRGATGSTAHATWCVLERDGKAVSPCPALDLLCLVDGECVPRPSTPPHPREACLSVREAVGFLLSALLPGPGEVETGARPGLKEERGGPPQFRAHVALAKCSSF